MPLSVQKGKYTYQDYVTWPDEERWELIDGVAFNMTPAPSFKHQNIVGNFFNVLKNALRDKTCVPGIAPVDVVLSEYDVVQPDVFVVCDPKKITDKNIQGAPDLIIEILSPFTSKKDRWNKKNLYERYGVLEYILIDPDGEYVERYLLKDDNTYDKGAVFERTDTIILESITGIEISLSEVFE